MTEHRKNAFFSRHAKSSAAFISLAIHALFIVVAISFVAVTVIQKADQKFDAKPVNRPRMQLKKLQVPVNIRKKKVQRPKLRKRIVVTPRMNNNMPDIKMPEISGVKGGIGGAADSGLGGAAGLGFSMPEIEVFGVKSKGEKVFIILDSSPAMMADEMGGIPAYTVIKQELVRLLEEIPATTLFNIAVYDVGNSFLLFPDMVSANSANVAKVSQWLEPLNAVRAGMGDEEFGAKTLAPGGKKNTEDLRAGKFKGQERWYSPAMVAMQQQADAVFLLTNWWGNQRYRLSDKDKAWYQGSAGRKWDEHYQKGLKLLEKDNRERESRGDPPRALRRSDKWAVITTYFPDLERPPDPGWYHYTPKDFVEAMLYNRKKFATENTNLKSGIKRKSSRKVDFSLNVVHFRETVEVWHHNRTEERFKMLTGLCKGDYRTISGLEAIKSYVQGASND